MNIQDLYIYPIKSLGGIRLDEAMALQKGLKFDRRWMLVDEEGRFITQRVENQLALLQTRISSHGIEVQHKQQPELNITVPFHQSAGDMVAVSVWDDTVTAEHIHEDLDDWFTEFLRKPCRLVYQAEGERRPVDIRYAENEEQVSFADAFPYLLISQASLDELNSRLEEAVPMDRFRPNIVVSGTDAFEEDTWAEIQIGEVRFKVAKPCARCVLTTVDQETGIKGNEPLNALAQYRTQNNKVMFGQNLIALNEGVIRAGDPVRVISLKLQD